MTSYKDYQLLVLLSKYNELTVEEHAFINANRYRPINIEIRQQNKAASFLTNVLTRKQKSKPINDNIETIDF